LIESPYQALTKYKDTIEESRKAFPNAAADTFPVLWSPADSNSNSNSN